MTIRESIPARPFVMANMSLYRVLPHLKRKMVGPFIFMDQGGPITISNSSFHGIPEHPHAGLSTCTYLMEGSVRHEDSAGFRGHVRSGDVALMTAGSGISHEENPVFEDGTTEHIMYFAQMWLALPNEVEDMPPTFEHHLAESIPVVQLEHASARVAMGSVWGKTAPTTCYVPTFYTDISLNENGCIPLSAQYQEQAVYILEGDASIDDIPLSKHTLYIIDAENANLSSTTGCRALYFGGDAFPNTRWIGGSFVASSKEKLQYWMKQAYSTSWPKISRES